MKKLSAILLTASAAAAAVCMTKSDILKNKKKKLSEEKDKLLAFKNEMYELLKESAKAEKNLVNEKMKYVNEEKEALEKERSNFHKEKLDLLKELESREKEIVDKDAELKKNCEAFENEKNLLENEKTSVSKQKNLLEKRNEYLEKQNEIIDEKRDEISKAHAEREKLLDEKNKFLESEKNKLETEWQEKNAKLEDDIALFEKEKEEFKETTNEKEKKIRSWVEDFLASWNNENKTLSKDEISNALVDEENVSFPEGDEEKTDVSEKIPEDYFSKIASILATNNEKNIEEDMNEAESENSSEIEEPYDEIKESSFHDEDQNELNEPVSAEEDIDSFADKSPEESLDDEEIEKTAENLDIVKEDIDKDNVKNGEKTNDIKLFYFVPENDIEGNEVAMFSIKFDNIAEGNVEIIVGKDDETETKHLIAIDNEINFSLNPNEKAVIKNVPVGTVFSAKQNTADGFETKSICLTHKELSKAIRKTKIDPNAENAQEVIINYLDKHNKLQNNNLFSNETVKDNKGKEINTYLFVNFRIVDSELPESENVNAEHEKADSWYDYEKTEILFENEADEENKSETDEISLAEEFAPEENFKEEKKHASFKDRFSSFFRH